MAGGGSRATGAQGGAPFSSRSAVEPLTLLPVLHSACLQELPKCATCGASGYIALNARSFSRALVMAPNGLPYCKKCGKDRKKEVKQFEKV